MFVGCRMGGWLQNTGKIGLPVSYTLKVKLVVDYYIIQEDQQDKQLTCGNKLCYGTLFVTEPSDCP